MRYYLYIVTTFLYVVQFYAQESVQVKINDSVKFNSYIGTQKFKCFTKNDSVIRHGEYVFDSDLVHDIKDSKGVIKHILIEGEYNKGLKNKVWKLIETDCDIEIFKIRGNIVLNLQYTLEGYRLEFNMPFNNGLPDGDWSVVKKEFLKNRNVKEYTLSKINYNKGLASGAFSHSSILDDKKVAVIGQLNEKGFF
jgi:hypothetical protein